jgi:hypothetical protein
MRPEGQCWDVAIKDPEVLKSVIFDTEVSSNIRSSGLSVGGKVCRLNRERKQGIIRAVLQTTRQGGNEC